jgi:hypothetical protein
VARLPDARDHPIGNGLAVLFPRLPVLLPAANVVAVDPVDQKGGKVKGIEVRQDVAETAGETKGCSKHDIAEIVDVNPQTFAAIKMPPHWSYTIVAGIRQASTAIPRSRWVMNQARSPFSR